MKYNAHTLNVNEGISFDPVTAHVTTNDNIEKNKLPINDSSGENFSLNNK